MKLDEFKDLKDHDRVNFTNPVTGHTAKGTIVRCSAEEVAIVWDDTHRVQRVEKSTLRIYQHLYEPFEVVK